jgi:hypothetical protein
MRRLSPWLTALLQTVILLMVVAYATPWLNADESLPSIPRRSDDIALRGRQARPVFNGSVVAGGVYSLDELRAVIDRDPVVAEHYRDIDLDRMEAVTLIAGRAAYVSYRVGDTVRWTRERVWLQPGETVFTDGATMIRARCGNCVSDVKQENVAAVDPARGDLDDFVVPPTPETGVDAFAADAEARLGDLLRVPFAPSALAWLAPGAGLLAPDLLEGDPVAPSPFGGVPPLLLGGSGGVEDGGNPDDRPQPPALVPDIPGSPTGLPPDTLTTGAVPPTGDEPGALTGTATDGSVFPTTTAGTSTSTGATPAPEPGMLWLVACGLAGLASRRVRTKDQARKHRD